MVDAILEFYFILFSVVLWDTIVVLEEVNN